MTRLSLFRTTPLGMLFRILLLLVVPFYVFVAVNDIKQVRREAEEHLLGDTRMLAQAVRATMTTHTMMLQAVGEGLLNVGALQAPANGRELIDRVAETDTGMAGIGLARTDGQLVLVSRAPPGQPLPDLMANEESRPSFVAAVQSGTIQMGRPYLMPAVKQWVIPIRVPLRDAAGRTLAVMGAGYRMDGGTAAWARMSLGLDHTVMLLRDDGYRVYLHPLPGAAGNELFERIYGRPVEADLIGRLRALPRNAKIVELGFAGRDMLAAWEPLDEYGVHALTLMPLDQLRRDQFASLVMPTLWLLAFLAGGYLIYRHTQRLQAASDRQLHGLTAARQAILDGANYMIVATDRNGVVTSFNQAGERMLGYGAGELIGMQTPLLWHDTEEVARRAEELSTELGEPVQPGLGVFVARAESGHPEEREWTFITKDGRRFTVLLSISQIQGADGEIAGFIGIAADITDRKQAEERLHLSASVFTHAREGIMITDADGTIIDVNDAFTDITGYGRDEVLGCNPRILNSGRQDKAFFAAMWNDLLEKGHWYGEVWNQRKNGEIFAEMQTVSAVRDARGKVRQYVALFSDITPIKEHERQLEHIAHYDALTSLPNRLLLSDRLHQAMSQTQRRGQHLAVAYLDLDGFKAINDRHGHEAGDQLLMSLASRMKQALREGDTLARLGGDEFVAVLLDLDTVKACAPMLTRLLAAAAEAVPVGDIVLQVSASVGVTLYPQVEDVDADQLLRQADQAMYQAKLAGKNRYHVFDADQDRSVRGHHEGLERIRRALAEREFVLHYQPKVNMRTGAVVGAEALIRWQHPERGLLPPAAFLPVVEDHPLAVDLGEWVIDTALSQIETWKRTGFEIPVSINVGARQLQQADFVGRLRDLLAAHPDVEPSSIELEVLETSALEDLALVSQVIKDCRQIGVNFALDDFGTGYSSLTYLKHLSVAVLKIDQSFVRDMLDDPDDLAILEGVLGLSIAFRRQAVAEGVETLEHGEMLLQLGCDFAQGYSIARPMPAHELPAWQTSWHPDPRWLNATLVSRDDLPLLVAGVDHRAWILAIEACLKGEREAPPPLDHHQCRLGTWLDAEDRAGRGEHPAVQTIETLHRQVHTLAVSLCEAGVRGRNPKALTRLGELHALRDTLLARINELLRHSSC